jgi:hypothetical protein
MCNLTPAEREWLTTPRRYVLGLVNSTAIADLDAIDPTGDPEHAHIKADKILLDALGPEVEAAYDRLVARASWW